MSPQQKGVAMVPAQPAANNHIPAESLTPRKVAPPAIPVAAPAQAPCPRKGYSDPFYEDGHTKQPNMVIDSELMSLAEKMVYLVLLRHAWADPFAYPAQNTLAEKCRISVASVRRALKSMEQKQLITIEQAGFNRPNTYHLLTAPDWLLTEARARPK